ncbi:MULTISPECIES: YciI family protein [unclassified Kribbella]|uniref:YciI family protein n=1 Tax=unclassified Kribbella TaxID=2644121 RepID=UPI0033CFDC4D
MTQYLISFEDGAMDVTEEELPQVAEEAHAVVQAAKDAGVFVFTGGVDYRQKHARVDIDGMITDGPYPESKELIGGVFVIDVPTLDDALEWAAKVAVACRCAQDVREFFPFRRTDWGTPS